MAPVTDIQVTEDTETDVTLVQGPDTETVEDEGVEMEKTLIESSETKPEDSVKMEISISDVQASEKEEVKMDSSEIPSLDTEVVLTEKKEEDISESFMIESPETQKPEDTETAIKLGEDQSEAPVKEAIEIELTAKEAQTTEVPTLQSPIPVTLASFRKPLTDLVAKENDTITLTCELSQPNIPCIWLKNDLEIKPTDHTQISCDGYSQQLVLTDVTVDDTARYCCVCGDVSTEAMLQVEGR